MSTLIDPVTEGFDMITTDSIKSGGQLRQLIPKMLSVNPKDRPTPASILTLPLQKLTIDDKIIYQKQGLSTEQYEKLYDEILHDL